MQHRSLELAKSAFNARDASCGGTVVAYDCVETNGLSISTLLLMHSRSGSLVETARFREAFQFVRGSVRLSNTQPEELMLFEEINKKFRRMS